MSPTLEFALEFAVCGVAFALAARVAFKPAVRRELRAHPALAVGALALVGLGLAVLVGLSLASDPLRRLLTGLVALGLAVAAWRARPGYGVARGLPPGSLGLAASFDALADRDFYLRQAALHGPVFKTSQFGQPVVCVLGLERGRELLARHAGKLEGATLPYTSLIPKGDLRFMERDDHRPMSGVFRSAILGTPLEASEAVVRTAFRSELGRLAARSRDASGARVHDALDAAVSASFVRILYGFAPDHPAVGAIRETMGTFDFTRPGGPGWRRRILEGVEAVTEILRTNAPAPTSSLGQMLEKDPQALDDPTIAGNLVLIFKMGQRDLTDLLDWVFKLLSDNPEWIERLRGAPDVAPPEKSLATRVVQETLRLEQSEYLYRRAATRIEFGGHVIPERWLVRICVRESHRDPDVFPNPERFDPDRFAIQRFGPSQYAPLGADAHGCMGPAVIHFVGRIFVEELCRGFDWQIVSDGPFEHGFRHWLHWQPSSRLRARFATR